MPNHKFIEAVAPHLVPVLLEQLTKQESDEPDQDDSSWNMAMAAGTCLGLMARAAKDALVPLVLPFVHSNITRASAPEDWHFREAATFAFGSILDGPSPSALQQVVQQGLVYLLQALGQVGNAALAAALDAACPPACLPACLPVTKRTGRDLLRCWAWHPANLSAPSAARPLCAGPQRLRARHHRLDHRPHLRVCCQQRPRGLHQQQQPGARPRPGPA